MSISGALNNAITGLNASSRMAEVVSSNIANSMTDGYGRRSVELSAVNLGGQGAGVHVDGISRHVDHVAVADRRLASADLGNRERTLAAFNQLEAAFGAPGDPNGLSGRLAALEQSLLSAASDPASEQRLGVVATRLGQLTDGMQSTSANIQRMRQDADADIVNDINALNRSLQSVADLNADIVQTALSGRDPSALLDARQVVLDQISSIVPIRLMSRDNGAVAVMTTSGEVMVDGPAAEYEFSGTPTIVADMSFSGGVLQGITRKGQPLSATDGFGKLNGGSLEASFNLRDNSLPKAQASLDQMAADLISRFQSTTTDPSLTPGDPGLLTDDGLAYSAINIEGLSSRMRVSAAIDPLAGGEISRIRDGIGAATAGPIGSGQQLSRWSSALAMASTISAAIPSLSASGQMARIGSELAGLNLIADQELSFASAKWDTLNSAVLSDGVDTDYEMQMLLRIEQSYSANAKLIQTADRMLQTLMEI